MPAEWYKAFKEQILPILYDCFNYALKERIHQGHGGRQYSLLFLKRERIGSTVMHVGQILH